MIEILIFLFTHHNPREDVDATLLLLKSKRFDDSVPSLTTKAHLLDLV